MKYTKTLIFAGMILASVFTYTLLPGSNAKTYAVNGSDFEPGRIMDDAIFFKYNSMSVAEIQKFLDSKMPNCNTNHSESSHWKDFGQPYICLKDYREDPTVPIADCTDEEIQNHFGFGSEDSRYEAAKNYCWWKRGRTNLVGTTAGSSSKSAARIIWDAAQEHRINPQVLIVTLQKEQSLLTDDYPWVGQYQKAMGYACPDTADCDPQFRGFYNQVHNAARQFRRYVTYPEQYNHAVGDNYVRYHPNSSCGGSQVKIVTQATAAFYNYTPYQPNAASLSSYPGTGDSCSSYGNRNYWFKFNEWFGSTRGTPLFRFGNNDRVYILGENDSYYYIPSREILHLYGHGSTYEGVFSVDETYVSGMSNLGKLPPVVRFDGGPVYLADNGKLHRFSTRELFEGVYGFTLGDEAHLPEGYRYTYFTESSIMQTSARESDGPKVYSVEAGKKRHIASREAYENLGSPVYSSREEVALHSNTLSQIVSGAPILTKNKLLLSNDTGKFNFWDGSQIQGVSSRAVVGLGISTDYTSQSSIINQLPTAGVGEVDKLVKDESSLYYLLDKSRKIPVDASAMNRLGVSEHEFVQTPNWLLNHASLEDFRPVSRIEGGDKVYLFVEGEKRHVTSRKALSDLGFTLNDVLDIDTSSANLLSSSQSLVLPFSTLYRVGDTNAVYLINDVDSSLHIPSRQIMNEYGFSMTNVTMFKPENVSDYQRLEVLGYIHRGSSGKIWLVHSKLKREITEEMSNSTKLNLDTSSLNILDSRTLKNLKTSEPLTELIRVEGADRVYKIQDGEKRWITSREAFISNGYSFDDVTSVSKGFVESLPDGPNIE